jgi:hypothetical protein
MFDAPWQLGVCAIRAQSLANHPQFQGELAALLAVVIQRGYHGVVRRYNGDLMGSYLGYNGDLLLFLN